MNHLASRSLVVVGVIATWLVLPLAPTAGAASTSCVAYVTTLDGLEVADLETNAVTDSIDVGDDPLFVTVTPDGTTRMSRTRRATTCR